MRKIFCLPGPISGISVIKIIPYIFSCKKNPEFLLTEFFLIWWFSKTFFLTDPILEASILLCGYGQPVRLRQERCSRRSECTATSGPGPVAGTQRLLWTIAGKAILNHIRSRWEGGGQYCPSKFWQALQQKLEEPVTKSF